MFVCFVFAAVMAK